MFPLQQHLAVLGIVRDQSCLAPGTVHTRQRSSLYLSIATAHVSCWERNLSFHNISIKNGYHEVSSRGVCFLLWIVEEAWSSDLIQVVLHVQIGSLGQINAVKGHILLALCNRDQKDSSVLWTLSPHLLVMIESFPLTISIFEAFWICLLKVPDLLKQYPKYFLNYGIRVPKI